MIKWFEAKLSVSALMFDVASLLTNMEVRAWTTDWMDYKIKQLETRTVSLFNRKCFYQ